MRTLNSRTQGRTAEPYKKVAATSCQKTLVTKTYKRPYEPYYLIPTRILNDQTRGTNEEPYRCAVPPSCQQTLVTRATSPSQPYYLIAEE